ncbi:MAG TPA: phosphotransferase [Cyclobacteriaceae bacterium]|nr:phosphotransferase [Cyclobacteriaceae bacterium]
MKLPMLKMEGRSGCRLEVFSHDGVFRIRKFSKDRDYDARLMLQAKKQEAFFLQQTGNLRTPEVLRVNQSKEGVWFEMPYLHGYKYSEFFDRASIIQVRQLGDRLLSYLFDEFNKAVPGNLDPAVFHNKLAALHGLLINRKDLDHHLVSTCLAHLKQLPSDPFPAGKCHGDMTFSNMIFCDEVIYLVDFLDSFIDSPLMDLVKLRQDTAFYWSLHMDTNLPAYRHSKIIQVFEYLDQRLTEGLREKQELINWYNYLQVFNFVRILPYVSEMADIQFVQHALHKLVPIKS